MRNTASGDNGTRYNKGAMAIHLEAVFTRRAYCALWNRLPWQSISEST
jgi:hypothetical protein